MDLIWAIILGAIQGFTEWLPISSSGHLVVLQAILGVNSPTQFDIAIMLGTVFSLIIYFRKRILEILTGLLAGDETSNKYTQYIIIAGIGTVIIAVPFRPYFEYLFDFPKVASLLIILTGLFLLFSTVRKNRQAKLDSKRAFAIGLAQGFASAPGISRSGSTISTGILSGMHAHEAAEFSFIIGIPAMFISSVVELFSAQSIGMQLDVILVGVITAFITGYISIGFFLKLLKQGKIRYFAYYCIIAGTMFSIILAL